MLILVQAFLLMDPHIFLIYCNTPFFSSANFFSLSIFQDKTFRLANGMFKILLFIQCLKSILVDSSQTMVSVNLKDEYS